MDERFRLPSDYSEPMKHYTEAMTKVTEEVLHFATTRCQHLTEMATELSQCRDPAKLMEVNLKWFSTTMDDYTREGARMMSIMQEMAHPMKQSLREAGEKTLHSVGAE